ncbi:hypothetical protein FQA39_LY19377 [Lamprigera yunnana]|nr:hypothetical protein FQA39_LY19377 [Lamprigera yunnana]
MSASETRHKSRWLLSLLLIIAPVKRKPRVNALKLRVLLRQKALNFYIWRMQPYSPAEQSLSQAAASSSSGGPAANAHETKLIWVGTEGQLVNFWPFVAAVLLCWLVVPVLWAIYRYVKVANHRYELTDQRLLEYSGIFVKHVETLELYRVKDIAVSGTLLQAAFGRGRVVLQTTDASTPTVVLNAIANPQYVSQMIRDAVERCRMAKGAIQDLKHRLETDRPYTPPLENAQQQYGFNTNLLKEITQYWKKRYNWREREKFLNQFPQYKTNIQAFEKFYVQGGDWGAIIATDMATFFPKNILGLHSNMCMATSLKSYLKLFLGSIYPPLVVEKKYEHKMYPLNNLMLYWLPNSFTTAIRLYSEGFRALELRVPISTDVPCACARFGQTINKRLCN